jgi:hypothetical protein
VLCFSISCPFKASYIGKGFQKNGSNITSDSVSFVFDWLHCIPQNRYDVALPKYR